MQYACSYGQITVWISEQHVISNILSNNQTIRTQNQEKMPFDQIPLHKSTAFDWKLDEEKRTVVAKKQALDFGDASVPRAVFDVFGLSVVWCKETNVALYWNFALRRYMSWLRHCWESSRQKLRRNKNSKNKTTQNHKNNLTFFGLADVRSGRRRFSIESTFTCLKHLVQALIDEIRTVVTEKTQFDHRK